MGTLEEFIMYNVFSYLFFVIFLGGFMEMFIILGFFI